MRSAREYRLDFKESALKVVREFENSLSGSIECALVRRESSQT